MIMIEKDLVNSHAYGRLGSHSLKVFIWFLMKRKISRHKDSKGNTVWDIVNNGKLVFTYNEAGKRGLSRKQFHNAIDDLIEKGFLEVTHKGTVLGDPSTFLLSENWRAYGTRHFK